MKKLIIACLVATFAAAAHADYAGPGAQPAATTVQQLTNAGKDDQRVVLRGHVLKAMGDEKYTFSDGTGEIAVKIDPKRWPAGQQVSETTTVELTGKYDKELFGKPKVKVHEVRVVQ
ncbi:YgiW/YdeI family stress tolerance OB fold protein [Paraburkholderia silviterrae]|uniref:NirD/YgiW/YdeI family stress tolerance protein n=1 Tax=Paraburkholderia silviterrae TaxID=2528715 RepID=A0A4R5M1X5_9BURK|nr:NirD/YgiW/YdeI family stress tolerance protein [Paraburkholderia silviterrae]TDG19391.1 NirD/YgiW/YdeI family stress tolerance protein [Paraburkholderia silviterrae]